MQTGTLEERRAVAVANIFYTN